MELVAIETPEEQLVLNNLLKKSNPILINLN